MKRVWSGELVGGGPVVFFGVDSPDVPGEVLAGMLGALDEADVAVGAVDDGGYWTLMARDAGSCGAVLEGILWGGEQVYEATCERAEAAGLRLMALPAWHDVDDAGDLEALRARLAGGRGGDKALAELAAGLDRVVGGLRG